MKYLLLITLTILLVRVGSTQTVIEMTHPLDANLVLLEVDNIAEADIAVYRTDSKEEIQEWDCKWKFKTWGFCNFSVYLTNDLSDPLLKDEDTGREVIFNGKVYFTDKKEEAGYKTEGFSLEGVFRKTASN